MQLLTKLFQNWLPLRDKYPNKKFFWSCIQTDQGKYRLEKTPYQDTFHAMFNIRK